MPHSLEARGVYGELRKSYRVVARFRDWSLDGSGRIEGVPTDTDAFWLEQGGPFAVWLKVGRRFWVWREADLLDAGTPLVVRALGSPDVRD